MGKTILPIHLSVINDMFYLPKSYTITSVRQEGSLQIANFVVESDEIPDMPQGKIPEIVLIVHVERHPDNFDFKKITVTPKIAGSTNIILDLGIDQLQDIKDTYSNIEGRELSIDEVVKKITTCCEDAIRSFISNNQTKGEA